MAPTCAVCHVVCVRRWERSAPWLDQPNRAFSATVFRNCHENRLWLVAGRSALVSYCLQVGYPSGARTCAEGESPVVQALLAWSAQRGG
jgi:hypothetical protein